VSEGEAGWFESAFGELYQTVYSHRDEPAATREIGFVAGEIGVGANDGVRVRVLDAACGGGRHARELARLGAEVTAMDLSEPLLSDARAAAGGPRYVRGDVRALPFRDRSFDAVVSLFTSFGYFDDAQDRQHLRELRRVVRRGARFVLDFLNSPRIRRTLVPRSERVVGAHRIQEERRIAGDRVEKDVLVLDSGGTRVGGWRESVRLYDAEELAARLEDAGFSVSARYGDLAGGPWAPTSDRLVLRSEAV
jgi:ubiquinone/menaquinone biosynthesis C-methylase UbiE